MGSLLTAGNLSLWRLSVEDQLLNSAAIISIVDDDESMRCALKSLVASLGLKAHAFASAEQFLQSQRLDDTACLITDLQMPGLNGIELQNLLLAQGRHIPIIFVTAFDEEPMRARALKAGALGFLSKPFESQTLAALIGKAIDTSRKTLRAIAQDGTQLASRGGGDDEECFERPAGRAPQTPGGQHC